MAIFCSKNLEPMVRVGQRLQKARTQQNLTLQDISNKTRIPLKYLEAIETARFKELPNAKAHRLAYIKEYAKMLNLNPASFLYQFSQESDLHNTPTIHPRRTIAFWPLNSLSTILRSVVVGVFLVGFVGYLLWQVNGILQPPKLFVFSPNDGSVSNKLTAVIQGETEKEVHLTVNGKEARPNDKGRFEIILDLSNGVNTINISAIKKHGKTTTITRHVIVKSNTVTISETDKKY
ncbi:MAG: helix-turn-helix domain-containing protein [Patescibacteria group bacterium]